MEYMDTWMDISTKKFYKRIWEHVIELKWPENSIEEWQNYFHCSPPLPSRSAGMLSCHKLPRLVFLDQKSPFFVDFMIYQNGAMVQNPQLEKKVCQILFRCKYWC